MTEVAAPVAATRAGPWRARLTWLFPLALTLYWLAELGLFRGMRYVVPGSDYYAGGLVSRLMQSHGGSIPAHLDEFMYPAGIAKTSIAEYLFETLWLLWPWLGSLVRAEPLQIMWAGTIVSTVANIWGTWGLLWARWGRESPVAVTIGWAVILLNSWAWMRTPDHWFLSWIPIYLWATLLAWDLVSLRASPSPLRVALAHALLLSQSVYFGIFQAFLMIFWSACSARRIARDAGFRRRWLTLACAVAAGYAVSSAVFIYRMGGLQGLHQATASTTRPLDHAYWYSFRVRELLRGGEGSAWNSLAQRVARQKTEAYAREGEGYPAAWPKLLFLGALLLGWRARRRGELAAWTRAERRGVIFAWAGLAFLLVLGLQETFFFRRYLIYPWLPQIRSYARLMMPIYIVTGVLALLLWKRIRAPGWALPLALALLLIDYGPPARAKSWRNEPVCHSGLEAIAAHPAPIFFQDSLPAELKHDLPELEDGCLKMMQDSFAFNGLPVIAGFRTAHPGALKPTTPECEQARTRVEAARRAHPSRRALWWFQGTTDAFESSRACLGAAAGRELFALPIAGGRGGIHLIDLQ